MLTKSLFVPTVPKFSKYSKSKFTNSTSFFALIKIVKNTLVESSCLLGESPVWDPDTEHLFWVDLHGGKLHRFDTSSSQHDILDFKKEVCAIARCDSGLLLVAFKRKLAVLEEFHTDALKLKTTLLPRNGVRFNDGQIDPGGRFWIGTMSEIKGKSKGVLMKVNPEFRAKTELRQLDVSNGMCWSPDASQFYHVDTGKYEITAYDFAIQRGEISNPRIIIQIPRSWGKPDGMTIDEEGKLWVALWGGWAVSRWDPETGSCIGMIDLPVSQVSSCVFGGKGYSDLYITSAKVGLGKKKSLEQPLAGSVFKISIPGVRGIPAHTFKL